MKNIGGGYAYSEGGSSAEYTYEGFSVESLSDVDISNPTNGQTLVYNATSEKWENGAGGGGVTFLQATYELNEWGNDIISLSQTAAELFALCSTGLVFITYTVPAGTYDPQDPATVVYKPVLIFVTILSDDTPEYFFALGDLPSESERTTQILAPTDTVVFATDRVNAP